MTATKGKEGKETLGKRIARLRKSRGLTQVELAKQLALGQSNLSDYERGQTRPNADMILAMASALQVSTDELLGYTPTGKTEGADVAPRLLKRVLKIQELSKRDQQALIRTIDAFLAKSK